MTHSGTVLRLAGVAAAALMLGGCPKTATQAPLLRDALGPTWTMVPLPNSALVPGAIVQVVPAGGGAAASATQLDLRWLGNLADCGVPAASIAISNATVPAINSGSTYALDASLGAKLAGVSAQLGGNASSTADFTIGQSTDSSLNFVQFQGWAASPPNASAMAAKCGTIFGQSGVYVVQEAFVVDQGSYSFKTDTGAKIGVTPPPNVPVTLQAGGDNGNSGSLVITTPVVFALKVLQPLPQGGFQVAGLATSTPPRATEMQSARHGLMMMGPPPAPPPPSAAPVPPAAPPPDAPPADATAPPLNLAGKSIGQVVGLTHP